jgi:predicted RNA-binding Zn-ribbon protein involved in translation (DUF1610 family)
MTAGQFSAIAVAARTHPPGYRLHKYWARKPHNVVRRALETCGVGPRTVVIDPCCGSGVPLSEAARLGATCIGLDVNPVAVELTRTTLDPPAAAEYRQAVDSVLDELERRFSASFAIDGRSIRYAVHATVVDCRDCGARISADQAPRRGRTYVCPECESRLYFNLENLVATRTLRTVLCDGSHIDAPAVDPDASGSDDSPCDRELTPNARILAFPGMRSRDLFSARTFAVLSAFAERVQALPERVRSAVRLTLTASVAQCSRLVAYRNNLTTGGPAWTVPGFWVPPLHLETNPLIHLRSRSRRFEKGLVELASLGGRGTSHDVRVGDARRLGESRLLGERRVSVVFFDPPYGDSVPYLEFSSLWNSFLGHTPDPGLDIAVSNRARGDGTWEQYRQGLAEIVASLRSVLDDDGRFIVTFNNKDLRAWRALLEALQSAQLTCRGAFYQHPAVVSTKAQLAPDGSYIGDIYAVFVPSTTGPADRGIAVDVVRRAREATATNDSAAVQRQALLELLRENVTAAALDDLPDLIATASR